MARYKKAKSMQEVDMIRQSVRSAGLLLRQAEMALSEYIRKSSKAAQEEQQKTTRTSKR